MDEDDTKNDLKRVGLFSDLGYIATKEKFRPAADAAKESSRGKGKQMQVSSRKTFDASQVAYFTKEFSRVFVGEAYVDQVRRRRQERILSKAKNTGKNWVPSALTKTSCGMGSFCACINTTPPAAFSPLRRPPTPKPIEPEDGHKRIFRTNPPKKGSGYGYLDITINKYPQYLPDSYMNYKLDQKKEVEQHKDSVEEIADPKQIFHCGRYGEEYFNKNPYRNDMSLVEPKPIKRLPEVFRKPYMIPSPPKLEGGMKAGTFSPYPECSKEKYRPLPTLYAKNVVNKYGKTYMPSGSVSSRPTPSILHQNIDKELTNVNYKTLETVMKY